MAEDELGAELGKMRGELSMLSDMRAAHASGSLSSVPLSPGAASDIRSSILDAHVDWLAPRPLSLISHTKYHQAVTSWRQDGFIGE